MMGIQLKKKVLIGIGVLFFIIIVRYYRTYSLDWDLNGVEIDDRAFIKGVSHDKWIVVTTIQNPTADMRQLVEIAGWNLVVVGDRRTPSGWNLPGAIYLNLASQKALGYRVHSYLPYDSYTRKIIGYLYAIEHGAQYIYETDDDNLMRDMSVFHTRPINKLLVPVTQNMTFNPYPHFGQSSMWPRGFPLEYIGQVQSRDYRFCSVHTPAIQQGLVNGDPDVDAIFRMTRKQSNVKMNLKFDSNAPAVMLPNGVFAPFNSQNTLFTRRAFWGLILQTSVTDRETDIYRSYLVQRLLWLTGNNLGFYPPNSIQKRNNWHSNVKDARQESSLYTNMGRYIDYLSKWECTEIFFFDCMSVLIKDLVTVGFLEHRDFELVSAWIDDLAALGYGPPVIKESKDSCLGSYGLDVRYYPWEQNTSMSFATENTVPLQVGNVEKLKQTSSEICGLLHRIHVGKALATAAKFDEILLVISISGDSDVIPVLDAVYKIHFPHILYCGSSHVNKKDLDAWKVTYIATKDDADPILCTHLASGMHYNVAGYLHITQNVFLQFEKLHVSSININQLWVTGGDLYLFDDNTLSLCGTNLIQCTALDRDVFLSVNRKLKELHPVSTKLEQYSKCLIKASQDPTLRAHSVTASKEITFYIPAKQSQTFQELTQYFLKDLHMKSYSFLAVLIMECLETAPEYLHSVTVNDMTTTGHYDYVFPFLFPQVKSDDILKDKYCSYIENH